MLRCIAIDDEELALDLLEDNIAQVPYLQFEGKFDNPLKAMQFLQEHPVDLVFLDIQMPGITGLQFIKSLPQKCMYILVTAYEKFAVESYSLNVVDYLVKPVALDRFIQACSKAFDLHQLKIKNAQPKESTEANYLFINVEYSLLKVVLSDIVWIEGLKDYIKIHLKSATKPVVPRMSMKAIEEQLPHNMFIRIHKSFIVSKEYITSIRRNSVFIGDVELPIGENYKDAVNSFTNNNSSL